MAGTSSLADAGNIEIPEFASWRSYRNFEERVKRFRRHIWDREIDKFLDTVMKTGKGRDMRISGGAILWRAQLGARYAPVLDNVGEKIDVVPVPLSFARMKPDPDHTREGRVNSSGIPVLYLASTKTTSISEVRPWVGSQVTVSQFRVLRQLGAIDLTQEFGRSSWDALTFRQMWNDEEPDPESKENAVWIDIDNAFSRPVELSDDKESYVPTRILAELFKEAGYDAIVYRSQFGQDGKDGYNIALFNLDDAEILNSALYVIREVRVAYDEVDGV